jgi:hypothetical protein
MPKLGLAPNLVPVARVEEAIAARAKANQRDHGGTAPGKTLPQKSAEVSNIETREEIAKLAGRACARCATATNFCCGFSSPVAGARKG